MNKIITLISFCFIFLFNNGFSQKLNYETTSPWFWGLNVGATWNTVDVKNQTSYGWGATLGRSFNYDYGNFFSFDIRARYLGGTWMGLDNDSTSLSNYNPTNQTTGFPLQGYKDEHGFTVNNFRTKAHEADLELVIHLNRLTEKTGLDPYIFGGVGFTWYNTKSNLFNDATDSLYNYSALTDFGTGTVKPLLDDSYETYLNGPTNKFDVAFMPHIGFGIGYYFGPRFSMGLEHKTTFTLADQFDGVLNPAGDYENDWYHYTSIYFRHHFKWRGAPTGPIEQPDPTTNNLNGGTGNCQKPIIRINGYTNNQTVSNALFNFTADVAHTPSRENITVTINGVTTTNYVYSPQTNKLEGSGYLVNGQNTIVVTSNNSCGTTTETLYLNYVQNCEVPHIRFTNPSNSGNSVSSNTFYVNAEIVNLVKNEGITFRVNGVNVSNYAFNPQNASFTSTISLKEGQNTIELIATNLCGTTSNSTIVVYHYNCPPPSIDALNTVSGTYVQSPIYTLEAQLSNVKNANQIAVTLNGVTQNSGQFNTSKGWYQNALRLSAGQNILTITTSNECGSTTQTVVVNLEEECDVPAIVIQSPTAPGTSVTNSVFYFSANVNGVVSKNNIVLRVNGISVQNFDYNTQTKQVTSTVSLQQGANTIEVIATNTCGTSTLKTVVNYNYSCPKPTVQFITPEGPMTVTTEQFLVQAVVSNITSANQVQLKLNGVLQSAGTYSNSIFKKSITLTNGLNTIELIATNNCGANSQSQTITYNKVVIEQVPTIIMTGVCDATVEAGLQYVSGTITHLTNANQVSITMNGNPVNNVTYVPTNQGLNFGFNVDAQITPETYVIVITATNSGGTVSKTCVIRVNKPEEKITICHYPPGNTGNPQTIEIPLSAWPSHQAHGDKLGECAPVVEEKITICHYPPGNTGNPQTIEIPLSAWPAHQAHGDKLGECPQVVDEDIVICVTQGNKRVTRTIKQSQWPQFQAQGATLGECPPVAEEKITICHYPPGNTGNPQTIEIPLSAWTAHQAHGDKLGECPQVVDEDIVICVTQGNKRVTRTIKQSQWPQFQAQGATLGECPPVAEEKITICHYPPGNTGNPQTIEIPLSAWPAHQAHGDKLGECPPVVEEKITICHYPPGNTGNPQTIEIPLSAWPAHQAHGDKLGECPQVVDEDIVICVTQGNKRVTRTIKQSQWPQFQAQGATLGECPPVAEEKITICHYPPGNTGNPQTIEIPLSAWPAHQAHGDKLGECPPVVDEDIVICVLVGKKRVTKTIKQSQWAKFKAQGATLGACPPETEEGEEETTTDPGATDSEVIGSTMVVCVEENGARVTKTIKVTDWPRLEAKGATKGKCEEEKIKEPSTPRTPQTSGRRGG